jgi:phosphoribosylamine--glycine ligase
MGAYTPVSVVEQNPELIDQILETVVVPTLAAMRARGTPFTGLLYAGLMLTADGPMVVEFNCRFGDPETQAVLPALAPQARIGELMFAIALGNPLPNDLSLISTRAAVTTVLAANGYPNRPRAGDTIEIPVVPSDVLVFHAGTKRAANGTLETSGGRVLSVTGIGDSLDDAQRASQTFASRVKFDGKQYRTDIGWRELARRAGAS